MLTEGLHMISMKFDDEFKAYLKRLPEKDRQKVMIDFLNFGQVYLRINGDGEIEYVPYESIISPGDSEE